MIDNNPVVVVSRSDCPDSEMTKDTLSTITNKVHVLEINQRDYGDDIQDLLEGKTRQEDLPYVFIGGQHIGGVGEVQDLSSGTELESKIKKAEEYLLSR